MKYLVGLILSILLSVSVIEARRPIFLPTLPAVNADGEMDTIIETELVAIHVLVRSSKKGYLKDLNSKDLTLYAGKKRQKIEFIDFDKSTNQYIVVFYPTKPLCTRSAEVLKSERE